LQINNYTLFSSTEVDEVIQNVSVIEDKNLLIHIISYIHNRVLIQNLKQKLQKQFPNAQIVLLKHDDKTKTSLVIYKADEEVDAQNISHELLNQLMLTNHKDKTTLDECQHELLKRYFTDSLTDLPNIYQLRKDLQDNLDASLITISIDNFVTINNFYGYLCGDYVIDEFSKYLKENIDEKIYRTLGAEFSICLKNRLSFYDLKDYLTQLYKKLELFTIMYRENKIILNVTLASSSSINQDNLFSKVSMAMKYAKDNSLPFWIYEDDMGFENEYEKNLEVSSMIRDAVEDSKIIPYFQPITNNKTSKIENYECLARLFNKDDKIVPPSLFIPISKQIKLYNFITKIIIEKSFEAFKNNDYTFSINISMEDIINSDIHDFILEKLKSSDTSKRVIFEIVESDAIEDFERIERFIREIKRYGARISIDDFGAGYSNFSYLIKMNVDFLKIDSSLIQDIDINKNSYLVVQSIVEFANKLGIKTVAKFVHSSSILEKVKELGIDYSQGYFIDKPLISLE
jgi:diguanylate cyclase (GGDEF)-like protein